MDELLLLYSHCIIVAGASRSALCDLQRHQVHLIPNALATLLTGGRYFIPRDIMQDLDEEERVIVNEYLAFLNEQELAFYCSAEELEHFPAMSEEWLLPAHISNIVLDTQSEYDYFDDAFLAQLSTLCCNFIQFRFYESPAFSYLEQLLHLINESPIKSIEIILPEAILNYNNQVLLDLIAKNEKISNITLYGCGTDGILKQGEHGMGFLLQSKENISSHKYCGITDSSLFSVNTSHYTESLAHNTCLNRKLAIDTEGNIKNCPSMQESFGNISNTTLEEAINTPGFKKYWNIRKDEITKCKDCEFRHVCTDCRAYTDKPGDMYSAPLKCGYNPYTCEWEEWSTSPLKQKAIDYYGMRDIIKN